MNAGDASPDDPWPSLFVDTEPEISEQMNAPDIQGT
jgi:hypothetical protein